ncbi:MAG TPA: ABC transporter permease, partial [Gammaproteobacteria bacterium]|nr:ABC transporter permease [Gammaproteobacteria bacterium]
PFTFYLLASFIFLGITLISSLVQRQLEKKAHRGVGQA